MPVPFSEVVGTVEIGPIETDDERVRLRVDILHTDSAVPAYSARVWRYAAILLHPIESDDLEEVGEYQVLVEDETIGAESFAAESPEEVVRQIRHRIAAVYYIAR
jgi:hypothetical protein